MSLEQFEERITVAGNRINGKYVAYRMDSSSQENDMRKKVGLGTCHCCDYFSPVGQRIALIEETQLLKTVNRIRNEYDYLNDNKKDEMVNKRIRDEMQLKAYGAMLVLCRLSVQCASAKKLIQNKKYEFWLVASSVNTEEDKRYFDSLNDSLIGNLTQVLGKTLLDDVAVLTVKELKSRL